MVTVTLVEVHWFGTSDTATPTANLLSSQPVLLVSHLVQRSDTGLGSDHCPEQENSRSELVTHVLLPQCDSGRGNTWYMCERGPPQEMAHPSVLTGLHHQVPMIGRRLVGHDLPGKDLQSLGQDVFECLVVGGFVKNGPGPIAPIQGMVNRLFLVRTSRSVHLTSIAHKNNAELR